MDGISYLGLAPLLGWASRQARCERGENLVMRRIGFLDFPEAWDGPFALEFGFVSEHTRTVRFRAAMKQHAFDLYLPRFMLPGPEGTPAQTLVAVLDASRFDVPIGFAADSLEPEATPERCVYSFSEEKAHSHRFDTMVGGQRYSLYVPREVFGTRARPERISLELAISGASSE